MCSTALDPLSIVDSDATSEPALVLTGNRQATPSATLWSRAFINAASDVDLVRVRTWFGEAHAYASDCTGADSPLIALRCIEAAAKEKFGIGTRWHVAFQSEDPTKAGDGPRLFGKLNHGNADMWINPPS